MRRGVVSRWRRFAAGAGVLALTLASEPEAAPCEAIELWLWAWERPEDLRFVPDDVGVAFLTGTVVLDAARPRYLPRRQPLRVADGQPLMAVVRLEDDRGAPTALRPAVRAAVVDALVAAAAQPGVRAVQIDFDARASQRDDYRTLLREARGRLPSTTRLSITALASWCVFDRWVDADPWVVDETVPMLFDMGRDDAVVRRTVERTSTLQSPRCRDSVGVRTDQPWTVPAGTRRLFVFNPRPWTPSAFARLEEKIG
jgi:hypothetical protein